MNENPTAPVETRAPRAALAAGDHLTAFVDKVVASRRSHPRGLVDATCMAAARKYCRLMIRCLTSAGLGNEAIAETVHGCLGDEGCFFADDRYTAAEAFVRHCATAGVPRRQMLEVYADLVRSRIGWPDDPEEVAAITRAAYGDAP